MLHLRLPFHVLRSPCLSQMTHGSSIDARFVVVRSGAWLVPCTMGGVPCLMELPVPPSVSRVQPRHRRGSVIYEGFAGIVLAHS